MLQTDVRKPLVLAGIVVGLSIVLGLGGAYALAGFLERETTAVVTARVESARAATLAPRIATLKAQEERAKAYERVISLLLPTQEQLLQIPRDIEALARARGVEARFQFQGSAVPGETQVGASLPFSLTGSGTASAITSFLRDLEITNPRYTVSVATLDVSLAPDNSYRATASGNVYYQ